MEKDWDFDEVIDRSNTGSMKWEPGVLCAKFGRGSQGLLPMWVADMDLKCPTAVRKALEKRVAHQIYGYTIHDPDYDEAVVSWFERRHQWQINPEWIMTTPGVVCATNYLIQCFSKPGDKILIQTPVYYPFANAIVANGRQIQDNPLKVVGDRYEMDYKDLENKVKDPRVKMAILCSPHNPVGRVWEKEELIRFGRICIDNDVLIFADEIHCDLIMPGFRHISFQGISQEFSSHSIAATAASKTFNLAGLQQSALVIPNPGLRDNFGIYNETLGVNPKGCGTLFGSIATQAAYNHAEPWLEDLIVFLQDNFQYFKTRLETELPTARVFNLEGTYLAWVDFNPLGFNAETIIQIIQKQAGVALDHGDWFGENGAGYERFNLACPRSILKKGMDAILKAFNAHL